MTVEIVILAMIAAFLGLRLYAVLGRRAEHEEEPIQARFEPKPEARPAPRGTAPKLAERIPAAAVGTQREIPNVSLAVERGLRDIAAADRRFDGFVFVEGSRIAYGMILEAFWRGDKDELAQLCDRDVHEGFVAAIDARLAAGETIQNRLIRIEESQIVAASYQAPLARIGVRFSADIASVTRDKDGQVIAGSLDDAIEVNDVWTFSRNVGSSDPDWLLDETDEG